MYIWNKSMINSKFTKRGLKRFFYSLCVEWFSLSFSRLNNHLTILIFTHTSSLYTVKDTWWVTFGLTMIGDVMVLPRYDKFSADGDQ